MWVCNHCGAENDDDGKFCVVCGNPRSEYAPNPMPPMSNSVPQVPNPYPKKKISKRRVIALASVAAAVGIFAAVLGPQIAGHFSSSGGTQNHSGNNGAAIIKTESAESSDESDSSIALSGAEISSDTAEADLSADSIADDNKDLESESETEEAGERFNPEQEKKGETSEGSQEASATATPEPVRYITVIHGIQAPASDFLIPDSSSRYLNSSDLEFLDNEDKWSAHLDSQSAINEIYARYGYAFYSDSDTAKAIRGRLNGHEWYEEAKQYCPVARGENYELKQNYMNDIERANIQFIWDWQIANDPYQNQ